jgi:hypothetical protein
MPLIVLLSRMTLFWFSDQFPWLERRLRGDIACSSE